MTLSLDGYARNVTPKDDFRDSVMNRIYRYYQLSYSASEQSHESYAYTKFMMRTNHRNFTLAMVPSLYVIAHGSGREFMGEYYSKYTVKEKNKITPHRLLCITTVPHKRNTMPSLLNYLTPNVYGECLFKTIYCLPIIGQTGNIINIWSRLFHLERLRFMPTLN